MIFIIGIFIYNNKYYDSKILHSTWDTLNVTWDTFNVTWDTLYLTCDTEYFIL